MDMLCITLSAFGGNFARSMPNAINKTHRNLSEASLERDSGEIGVRGSGLGMQMTFH